MSGAAGLQMIVDDDAAIDGDAGVLCQRDIRPDAGRENHRVGLDPPSVRKLDAFDARRRHGCARCWR